MAKKASASEKIGIVSIDDDGSLIRSDGAIIIFYRLIPSNLAVLSSDNIKMKVLNLMNMFRSMGIMEMYAMDDRENFSENRAYLRSRIKTETNPNVRLLLEKDERRMGDIEADSSSARLFVIAFTIPNNQLEQKVREQLKNFDKIASLSQITVSRMGKDDVKRMLAVYFKHDTVTEEFPDVDGEDYYDDVDFERLEDKVKNPEQYKKDDGDDDDNDNVSFRFM